MPNRLENRCNDLLISVTNHAKVNRVFVNAAAYFVEFIDPWRDASINVRHIVVEAPHSAKHRHYRHRQSTEVIFSKPIRFERPSIAKQFLKTLCQRASRITTKNRD